MSTTSPMPYDVSAVPDCEAGHAACVPLTGDLVLPVRWIPPGTFEMGGPAAELNRGGHELPHWVTLTCGFWMAETPCTQAQWQSVMDSNPSHFHGATLPVESVTWEEACQFCRRLSEMPLPSSLGVPGFEWRLPTEAEWEYACRAGSSATVVESLGDIAWFRENAGHMTRPVGGKAANAWGLKDMQGNVWEWCRDWFGPYPYGPVVDPIGPASGHYRVDRGGCWSNDEWVCRPTFRCGIAPATRTNRLGFRPVLGMSAQVTSIA